MVGNNSVAWVIIGLTGGKRKRVFSSANLLSPSCRRAANALVSDEDEDERFEAYFTRR